MFGSGETWPTPAVYACYVLCRAYHTSTNVNLQANFIAGQQAGSTKLINCTLICITYKIHTHTMCRSWHAVPHNHSSEWALHRAMPKSVLPASDVHQIVKVLYVIIISDHRVLDTICRLIMASRMTSAVYSRAMNRLGEAKSSWALASTVPTTKHFSCTNHVMSLLCWVLCMWNMCTHTYYAKENG